MGSVIATNIDLNTAIDLFENPRVTEAKLDKEFCLSLAKVLRAAVSLADAARLEVTDCEAPIMMNLTAALDDWDEALGQETPR